MVKLEIDDKLPRIPPPTDKQLEANDAQQKVWATRTAPPNSTYARALAVITESEAIPLKDMVPIQRERYAEALANVGRFKDAVKVSKEKKDYYRVIDKAIWRDDSDTCKCKNHKTFDLDSNEVEHDRFFTVRNVWSEKHGKVMTLKKCNLCSHLNVRD